MHPKLKNDQNYLKNSYNRIKNKAENNLNHNNYSWVGFIEESELAAYYSACDFTIFPYTVAMSSSGPMSLSIAYSTPFILSNVFSEIFPDKTDMFELNPISLSNCLEKYINKSTIELKEVSQLRNDRLWRKVATSHINIYRSIN